MTKSRFYVVMFFVLFIASMVDACTGGTFSAMIIGGFSTCFLMLYAAGVEDSLKHACEPTYW